MKKDQKLWFKAKSYGWGWAPCSKEGWAVIVTYIVVLSIGGVLISMGFPPEEDAYFTLVFLPFTFLLTAIVVLIAYLTGEKPEWRWADRPIKHKK